MMDRLFGDQEYTYEDKTVTRNMVFVMKYLRMKHVIVFRLSNDVLQVSEPCPSPSSADVGVVQLLRSYQVDSKSEWFSGIHH
jgi:hypothetical protein